jgi:hypothetical protein
MWKTQKTLLEKEVANCFRGVLEVPTSFVLVVIQSRCDFFRELNLAKARNEGTEEVCEGVERSAQRWGARWLLRVHNGGYVLRSDASCLEMYGIVEMAAPRASHAFPHLSEVT